MLLGTENLRWIGESRFMYGFLKGLIANKSCPVQLEFLNAQQDKPSLLADWQADQKGHSKSLEDDQSGRSAETGWVKFEKPWLYFA